MITAKFSNKDLAEAILAAPVTVVRNRKAPKPLARAKSSKGFVSGTSGFSMGYPKSDLLSKFTGHKSTGHF